MSESAFDGTVKEGFKRRFTIINENDFEKYVPDAGKSRFNRAFNNICEWIEDGRKLDGKDPYNNYVVINLNEPYNDEVIEIMKRNGHWG